MNKEPTTPTNMTLQDSIKPGGLSRPSPPSDVTESYYDNQSQDARIAPQRQTNSNIHLTEVNEKAATQGGLASTDMECNGKETALQALTSLTTIVVDGPIEQEQQQPHTSADQLLQLQQEEEEEDCGRERLKRHRIEVAGHVWIPDIWGQEELLKDWIDCAAFDAALVQKGIMSARAALVEEERRANSGQLRVENRCQ